MAPWLSGCEMVVTPSSYYHSIALRVPSKVPSGLDSAVLAASGAIRRRYGEKRRWLQAASRIFDQAERLGDATDARLIQRLEAVRWSFRTGRGDAVLEEALALLTEAAWRSLGMRPYPVQIMGAIGLFYNRLIEMQPGEGKTITAALAAVLAGWRGRPCHVVTANTYLAQRDASSLEPLYRFSGLSTGCVMPGMEPMQRGDQYQCDVVYTTSKELAADFLRDRLKVGERNEPGRHYLHLPMNRQNGQGLIMRGLYTAIVDEVDSVLIDEAVTPLILSGKGRNQPLVEACRAAVTIGEALEQGSDYVVDQRYREIRLTSQGKQRVAETVQRLPNMWCGRQHGEDLILRALAAGHFYRRDKEYVIQDGRVVIVDEFTGRLMPERSWSNGMQQIIEARERLEPTHPDNTMARISFQRFFRFFPRLSGMTGTAQEESTEFWKIYRLQCVVIPPNRPCVRSKMPLQVYENRDHKVNAIVKEIIRTHETGRPVLVGTTSVHASEELAYRLQRQNLEFDLLNATRDREEAAIIARAGELGRITIATNMAGRGTDIKLGSGVAARSGLHVIATEPNEASRIDRQLFGRCARQGEPGTVQPYVSVDDPVLRRFLPKTVLRSLRWAVRRKAPGAAFMGRAAVARAQRTAQRMAYGRRVGVLRADDWITESMSFVGAGLKF